MNKIILMGRLTHDPETRYTQSAEPMAVCRYSLAVQRSYRKEGQPDTDFLRCVAFGRTGEFAEKYFKKGMMVAIEGSLRNNNWTDKEGVKRYDLDIVVEQQYFAESRASFESRRGASQQPIQDHNIPPSAYGGQSRAHAEPPPPAAYNQQSSQPAYTPITEDIDDDDLPF